MPPYLQTASSIDSMRCTKCKKRKEEEAKEGEEEEEEEEERKQQQTKTNFAHQMSQNFEGKVLGGFAHKQASHQLLRCSIGGKRSIASVLGGSPVEGEHGEDDTSLALSHVQLAYSAGVCYQSLCDRILSWTYLKLALDFKNQPFHVLL
jgi:hypothetical protein